MVKILYIRGDIVNREIIKVMEKANRPKKKHPFKTWWRKNRHIIVNTIFFPLCLGSLLYDKLSDAHWERVREKNSWSEARAVEILDYYIPKCARYDNIDKSFFFFDNGLGWNIAKKKTIKRKDRNFWKINKWKIRDFLIKKYEIEGFTKEVGNCSDGWTEITFTLNDTEEVIEK